MPRLIAAVYVQDPATREELILLPGECPDPEIAALVTNPDAWDVPPDVKGWEGTEVGEPVPAVPTPEAGQAADAQVGDKATAKKTTQRRARPAAQ
ncbi:hypothetical protein ABZW18_20950 [Streptomyces sp. NPDC004647]|uniref:hypothetical protein n=1 Tax=Streptomyces sp. NPDC004647 TaxID=3154671 RepID=UPI00339E0066